MIDIFVINLEKESEKLQNIAILFKKYNLNFRRINAVNGHDLEESTILKYVSQSQSIKTIKRELTNSEIGVALSHISIYNIMIKENIQHAIIMEDDIDFNSEFLEFLQYIERLPSAWEVVLLGHHVKESNFIDTPGILWWHKKITKTLQCIQFSEFPFGAYGYLLHQKGAKKLIKNVQPLNQPIDHYTADKDIVTLYGVYPACIRLHSYWGMQSNLSSERDRLNSVLIIPDAPLKKWLKSLPYISTLITKRRVLYRFFKQFKLPYILQNNSDKNYE